ncbi:tRNA pseudouridine synthase B [bacterium HR39]|nr:tRNA pseudouridine synthase B [bacterium HR39]
MTRRRQRGVRIDGWLVIDKPEGTTSTEVVNVVKRLTKAEKAGHGGTLDPIATGVLPVALGEATKTVQYVMEAPKRYRFTVRFGIATDTDDREGRVIAESDRRPTDEEIRALLPRFVGEIGQLPPRYSAIKVAGERAYNLARRGEEVELKPRRVVIHSFELVGRPDPDHAVFEVVCGKGAYVRALARDLGEALGCYGHIKSLRRLAVGPFTIEDAISLEALEEIVRNETLPQVLIPVARALAGIPALAVTEPQALRLRSGQTVRISPALLPPEAREGDTLAVRRGDEVVALARLEDSLLRPVRVFRPKASRMPKGAIDVDYR